MTKTARLALTMILAGGTALACGNTRDADDHLHQDEGEQVVVRLLPEPAAVPEFTITDLEGRSTRSTEWRGKVVLVNFWATWCAPCRAEIPDLVELQDKYRDQLVVVGVSEDEGGVEQVKRFAAEHDINYPVVMVTPELRKVFPGVSALPTTFVLDREGRLAKRNVGILRARETEAVTRVLAGLPVNARIEHIDQVKEMQGVDLDKVPADRKQAVLQALNAANCTCGCGLTVAQCRIDDPSCEISLPLAQAIVAKHSAPPDR
jgi:thiol-disulfide isomerase/thioredoxin